MSLEYLKVNITDGNSLDTPPEEFYRNYIENPNFINTFEKVMVTMNNMIAENFNDVGVTIYGRIKSENSYFQKSELKDRIFDIYAFKVIVNNVDKSHKCSEHILSELKDGLSKTNLSVDSDELINIAVAREISDAFAKYSMPFLKELKARPLDERNRNYIKDNGFISFQRTTKMYPDSRINIPCNVEYQCRTLDVDEEAYNNHSGHKIETYGCDLSTFPHKEFNNCKTLEDFNNLCEKFVPRYVYLKDNKLIINPNFVNFMHYYYKFLFERNPDSSPSQPFKHQSDVDKLNYFIDLETKGFSPIIGDER